MTKKDYQMVAAVLSDQVTFINSLPAHPRQEREAAERLRLRMAAALAAKFRMDNPNFESTRFLQACRA